MRKLDLKGGAPKENEIPDMDEIPDMEEEDLEGDSAHVVAKPQKSAYVIWLLGWQFLTFILGQPTL